MTPALAAPARRPLRFVIVGAGAAGLFFVLIPLFVFMGMPPAASSVLAYAIAFVFAYTAQRSWTFGALHDHAHALPRYVAVQAGCAAFAGLAAHVAVSTFSLSPFVMSAIITLATSAASYVLSSLWVFRGNPSV